MLAEVLHYLDSAITSHSLFLAAWLYKAASLQNWLRWGAISPISERHTCVLHTCVYIYMCV